MVRDGGIPIYMCVLAVAAYLGVDGVALSAGGSPGRGSG